MGWSIGYDEKHKRDIGYGVPAICDHPDCNAEIDRGLSYVCGGEPYGGEFGCGLYFCSNHLAYNLDDINPAQQCHQCLTDGDEYTPKPDTNEWVEWKLTDESWQQWRDENQDQVKKMKEQLCDQNKSGDE